MSMSLGYQNCMRVYDLRTMGCSWAETAAITGFPAPYVPIAYAQAAAHIALNQSPAARTA